jgi:hypothetical protein
MGHPVPGRDKRLWIEQVFNEPPRHIPPYVVSDFASAPLPMVTWLVKCARSDKWNTPFLGEIIDYESNKY